jgi:hypothetical protein
MVFIALSFQFKEFFAFLGKEQQEDGKRLTEQQLHEECEVMYGFGFVLAFLVLCCIGFSFLFFCIGYYFHSNSALLSSSISY